MWCDFIFICGCDQPKGEAGPLYLLVVTSIMMELFVATYYPLPLIKSLSTLIL